MQQKKKKLQKKSHPTPEKKGLEKLTTKRVCELTLSFAHL